MHRIDLSALPKYRKLSEAVNAYWMGVDKRAFAWDRTVRELVTPEGEIVRFINARIKNVSLLMDVAPKE